MAIAKMTKVLIVSHRSEAAELLEQIQQSSILEVLDAARTAVSKQWPELVVEAKKPKDIEELADRLEKSVKFLEAYAKEKKSLLDALAPRTVIEEKQYSQIVSSEEVLTLLEQAEETAAEIQKLDTEKDNCLNILQMLKLWKNLKTPLEELTDSSRTRCFVGLVPDKTIKNLKQQLNKTTAALQIVGNDKSLYASIVICLKENAAEVKKLLRSAEFAPVTFEKVTGTAEQIIKQQTERLGEIEKTSSKLRKKAAELAGEQFKLKILFDHYQNLLTREQTRALAPITTSTILLEGWVKEKDYVTLESIVSRFGASTVSKIKPREDEEIPVEIENKPVFRPFEVITRLYGMPQHLNIDPTVFLAPFFAVFFGMCLADAGYGLMMIALTIFFLKKIQGDKKLMLMLTICAATTVIVGALTGGWFGDAIEKFFPALLPLREKLMWFDPFKNPMRFFILAIGLGYFQIITGLFIAFVHHLKRKEFIAAVCDKLTWLVMLNSLVIFGASKAGVFGQEIGTICGYTALIPAVTIFIFSHREGGLAARLGMGFYNLFSSIFYLGDVLSYLRLMALGMVSAGLSMAINVIAKIAREIPAVGLIVMILILVGGHIFNLLLAILSAFVHTLRLQYVEFFPKFLISGGREFKPLSKEYKYTYVKKT
jgi:V/A-type H+-transporting ATPase subunit I